MNTNFKKVSIILFIIFIILCVATVFKIMRSPAGSPVVIDPSTTLPISTTSPVINPLPVSSNETIPIQTSTGLVLISDIKNLPEVQDVGKGMYHLQGPVDSSGLVNFALLYSTKDNSFSISIERDPIAQNRILASEYLVSLLNISKSEACQLKVLLGVPYSVNEQLSGKNLGLSFCPGSINL